MDEHTTILIGKKTRSRLANLKSYRRESYDETLNRILAYGPRFASSPQSVRRALELVGRFCDGPRRSFDAVEAEIRRVEKEADEEVLNVP